MATEAVYIGLGSNLNDPINQVRSAISAIDDIESLHLTRQSSLYRTAPMGPQNQPDYINAAVQVHTCLPPLSLLDTLQSIETKFGRIRLERWGARVIDLDILLYGQRILNTPRLRIPHYGLTERSFVLVPLAEIDKTIHVPGRGAVESLLSGIKNQQGQNLEKI